MIKHIHWAWVILFTSFAILFIHYGIRLGYGILMPEMILSLKIRKAQAGPFPWPTLSSFPFWV